MSMQVEALTAELAEAAGQLRDKGALQLRLEQAQAAHAQAILCLAYNLQRCYSFGCAGSGLRVMERLLLHAAASGPASSQAHRT